MSPWVGNPRGELTHVPRGTGECSSKHCFVMGVGAGDGRKKGKAWSTVSQKGKDSQPLKNASDCSLSLLFCPDFPALHSLTHLIFMSYQPPALPSREEQNSQMKTECQTPRKAFQCPLPRRGSHYNGAWTSAMSPGRGEAISFHLTQFAGPRRRLTSRQHPRSQIPLSKSSYQIGLKTASKGPGGLFPTRHPAGHMATAPPAGTALSTGDRGN